MSSRLRLVWAAGLLVAAAVILTLPSLSAHENSKSWRGGWRQWSAGASQYRAPSVSSFSPARGQSGLGPGLDAAGLREGKRLFERETFGGNGRTCETCHSKETGTVSPLDAQKRFKKNPSDPLFIHDGTDDGAGNGVSRMLAHATILMQIPIVASNVSIAGSSARSFTVRRGIPTTINTPGLDPVLMYDGRQDTLQNQAKGAIGDHAQGVAAQDQLDLIAKFQRTDPRFFSSPALMAFAGGGPAPVLPPGNTPSEKRGRRFFESVPPTGPTDKTGLCTSCHGGPMLNATNEFLPLPVAPGTRFQTILVSELNAMENPILTFVFTGQKYPDVPGDPEGKRTVSTPDPGRAVLTGIADDGLVVLDPFDPGTLQFNSLNAFKISPLWGVKNTGPYFHDNSAKTLEDVVAHYAVFFSIVTDPDGPGPAGPDIILTPQDQKDIVAFLKLL